MGKKTRPEMSAATLPVTIVWGLFLGRGMGEFRIALAIDRGPEMLFSPAERRVRPLAYRVARADGRTMGRDFLKTKGRSGRCDFQPLWLY
jgi:hypothetical protein